MISDFLTRLGFGSSDLSPTGSAHTVRGVRVELLNSRPDIDSTAVLERLDEALGLIETYQPWRLRHLRRDVRAIRVERYACRGAFIPSEGTIITELTFLARRDISAAPVASSILHEGVHARVHVISSRLAARYGGYAAPRDSAREERLCRRSELAFGISLPEELGAPVIERALASLQLDDAGVAPSVDWRVAQQRIDEVDRGG